MINRECIESASLSSIIHLEETEITSVINKFVDSLYESNKNKRLSLISFRLFNTRFTYYVDNQLLRTKIEDTILEISKGQDGIKITEDINSVTKDLDKGDSINKLIEYQKEKQVACKVYRKMKNKFLPKYKKKGLYKRRNK